MNYLRQFYYESKTRNTADEKQNCSYELLATLYGSIESMINMLWYDFGQDSTAQQWMIHRNRNRRTSHLAA